MHVFFVRSKAFWCLQRKKKRISKFCSWRDCIENPFLRANSFSCPLLHNFLSCSKSGFGSFFFSPSREGGGSKNGAVSRVAVLFWAAGSSQDKVLVLGSMEQQGTSSHGSATLHRLPGQGKDFFTSLVLNRISTKGCKNAGRMLFNTQFNLPTYLEEGISSLGGNGESFMISVIPQNIQLIMS